MANGEKNGAKKARYPIAHWSYSSLMAFLRNPLAWYKRYVEEVYDTPSSPAGIIGRAAHAALQHFYEMQLYSEEGKQRAVQAGLAYLRSVPDFEINFGKATSTRARRAKRAKMEQGYFQAISFYLERPPHHKVLGVEVRGTVTVRGLPLPLRAVSDLVVESKLERGALDIVDHKFVDSFSSLKAEKPLFVLQAIFNYYTVSKLFGKPVRRFLIYECKKTKNRDGRAQVRRYVIDFKESGEYFALFKRLLKDASREIARTRVYLPNPSDLFEGENSFDIYRLGLVEDN